MFDTNVNATLGAINEVLAKAKWIWQPGFRFDRRQGYSDYCFGARSGPIYCVDAVVHEMAHAIHAVLNGQIWRLDRKNFGLTIKTTVEVLGEIYYEPATMSATTLECEVFGIQWHLLSNIAGEPGDGYAMDNAKMLSMFMPDWVFGGDTEAERIETRRDLIVQSRERFSHMQSLIDAWEIACQHIERHHVCSEQEAQF